LRSRDYWATIIAAIAEVRTIVFYEQGLLKC
jgi:hypothetical protein